MTEKVFFNPGDKVKVKHFEDVPEMYVLEKVTKSYLNKETDTKESSFIGIKCAWFDKNHVLHTANFSTKDLIHI